MEQRIEQRWDFYEQEGHSPRVPNRSLRYRSEDTTSTAEVVTQIDELAERKTISTLSRPRRKGMSRWTKVASMAALAASTAISLPSTPSAANETPNTTLTTDTDSSTSNSKTTEAGRFSRSTTTGMKAGETSQVGPVNVSGTGFGSSKNELKGDGTQTETNKVGGETSIEVDGKTASSNASVEIGAVTQTTTDAGDNVTTGEGTYSEVTETVGANRGPAEISITGAVEQTDLDTHSTVT